VEWRNTLAYRARPKLPGEVKKYLRDNYPDFEFRWKALCKVKERDAEDCYEVLSGIAHGTALNSISSATKPEELIEKAHIVNQSTGVFLGVGECVSDIYVSCFEGNWTSLPKITRDNLVARFGTMNPRKQLNM